MASFSSLTVVFCVEDFPPHIAGGGGRSNAILASVMAEHFGRVIVIKSSASGLRIGLVSDKGYVTLEREAIAFEHVDIIQACGRADPTLVLDIQRLSKAPVIYTSRSNARAIDRLSTRPVAIERNRKQDALLKIAVAIVACSEEAASDLRSDYPQYAAKINAIHNALDPTLLNAFAADGPDLTSAKTPVFAFIGRLRLYKGLLDLLTACESLWSDGLVFDLVILGGHTSGGESHLEARLASACRRWPHYLRRYEWSDDSTTVASIYKSVHCVVVPSHIEAFGLVAVEALSAGRYVIASDAGGLRETVSTIPCALMYPRGDTAALAKHISGFISARLWCTMDTASCVDSVRRRFTTGRMANKYLELYAKVLRQH